MALKPKEQKNILTVLSDGSIRLPVLEGTEGATKREIKDKQTNEVTQIKHERVFEELSGKITHISFYDGDFGKLIQLTIVDNVEGEDQEYILSVATSSSFGEDIMKKLPAMNLAKEIVLRPYSFLGDNGKSLKGVSITQDGVKIENHFYDKEKKKALNGVPEPEGDIKKFDSDDWKIYFTKVRKFLVKNVEDKIIPELDKKTIDIDKDEDFK